MAQHESSDLDRRQFLAQAGAAATGIGLIASAPARAAVDKTDPREPSTGRLLDDGQVMGIGIIGVGGMGGSHLSGLLDRETNGHKVAVRAVSDCYTKRLEARARIVRNRMDRECGAYHDYTELLARDDIHGVVIATPDHWHAKIAIDAMEAGKDVYCQKPVTLTVEESLDVRDAVYRTGRVFQCGAQRTSNDAWWQARDFIAKGGIGKVIYCQSDYSRNSGNPEDPQGGEWNWAIDDRATDDPSAGRNYIDWEQWLGPAPERPFSKPRFFQFRKFWDYSGGIATDLLYHVIAPMVIATDAQAPEMVTGQGGIYVQHDDREVPDTFFINANFPGDFSMILTSSMANKQSNPTIIRGHRATMYFEDNTGGKIQIKPENEFAEWFKKEFGADTLHFEPGDREDHMTNWLNACRNRTECHCTAETAYRAMAVTKLACDSYRQEKVLFWDGEKEQQVEDHPRPNRISKIPAVES